MLVSHKLDEPIKDVDFNGTIRYHIGLDDLGKMILHRIDGPAFISIFGVEYWYYLGTLTLCRNQKDFERFIKLKCFI